MYFLDRRLSRLIGEFGSYVTTLSHRVENIEIRPGKIGFPCDITAIRDGFAPFANGELWSEPQFDNYALFRFQVVIPDDCDGKPVYLYAATNQGGGHNMIRPQMLLYVDGVPTQGLDTNHERVLLTKSAAAGQVYNIHIYAFSGMPVKTPYGSWVDVIDAIGVRLNVNLQVRDSQLADYYYNLHTPFTYLKCFAEDSQEYQTILHALNDSVSELDLRVPYSEAFYESVRRADLVLQEKLYENATPSIGKATLVGHTHIDVAWLWRYSHTRDKVARSFSTAVKLMSEYPDYRFMSSQAQLYAFAKEEQPALYQKIKEMAASGQWETEGAMWVEPDMNLVSGESIVRQILYGKTFFRKEFGTDCQVLWLPDVFGYSAALPQILKKAGIRYFMTAKIGGNERNRFPSDTFMWKGIDGSSVLSHLVSYMPGGYCTNIEGGDILHGWRNYQQKDINDDILIPFGYADGGGGPTEEQIESIKRLEKGLPGIPTTRFGGVQTYFHGLDEKVKDARRLPTWTGEIYFERHRGTYTSMARIKKKNRQCEFLLSNAEWLWALAKNFGGGDFPKAQFNIAMQHMLINQFHDVLPGSSIKEVYEDADALYTEAFAIGEDICRTAVEQIAGQAGADKNTMLVFNPYSKATNGYVTLDGAAQYVDNIPAKGFAQCPVTSAAPDYPASANETGMENRYYRLRFAPDGTIASLYDKTADRECFLSTGGANRLRIYEDKPSVEDNWNLDRFYTEREYDMPVPTVTVIKSTGERAVVRMERRYQSSRITQDIVLYARSPRIDFITELDWKEHSQVLRTEFPVDVNAAKATYEIQFGHLERSSTKNTSWEDAKFEVCGHKWADMADGGYGMALLNDCKYGFAAEGSVLSMTLLRCGNMPNPAADKELHRFTYSILPHAGSFAEADVVKEAYLLNNPLFTVAVSSEVAQKLPAAFSLFDCQGAILETIKPAEDGNGLILRMYEPHNRCGAVTLTCGCPVRKAVLCDLMEQPLSDTTLIQPVLADNGHIVTLPTRPFEIITLRLL